MLHAPCLRSPVLGLVFLFKYEKDPKPRDATYSTDTDVFFAQQVQAANFVSAGPCHLRASHHSQLS